MIKKLLAIVLMFGLLTGMSMMPDEDRELNTVELNYYVPFSRSDEDNTPMTWDEYAPVNIYVNDVLYPYALPSVDISDTETTEKSHVIYTFDDVLEIEMTLEDLAGNESVRSPVINMNYSDPTSPIVTCK